MTTMTTMTTATTTTRAPSPPRRFSFRLRGLVLSDAIGLTVAFRPATSCNARVSDDPATPIFLRTGANWRVFSVKTENVPSLLFPLSCRREHLP